MSVQSGPRPFEWRPGQGADRAALDRLARAFPHPRQPMGEAWFMGERRRLFAELLAEPDDIPVELLQQALYEIASGTGSFGPFDEWRDWFHYLLPRILPRGHETYVRPLLEITITAFMTQHPAGLHDRPYSGFRSDVLNTLGRSLMDEVCWPNGRLDSCACLNKYFVERRGLWFWGDASGKLSASLFFCLKYLRPEELPFWLQSVLAIPAPEWRAQVMVWLYGAHRVFTGAVAQPTQFRSDDGPDMSWESSHLLSGHYTGDHSPSRPPPVDFIPPENRQIVLETVQRYFTDEIFLQWLDSISSVPSLDAELSDSLFWFRDRYAVGFSQGLFR